MWQKSGRSIEKHFELCCLGQLLAVSYHEETQKTASCLVIQQILSLVMEYPIFDQINGFVGSMFDWIKSSVSFVVREF